MKRHAVGWAILSFSLICLTVNLLAGTQLARAAVTLMYFEAEGREDGILLRWETGSEINNLGFYLYRATSPADRGEQIGFIQSTLSVTGDSYEYLDGEAIPGVTYYYTLESLDTSGHVESYGPVEATRPLSSTPTPTPSPTATLFFDQEIVYFDSFGQIRVHDPFVPAGKQPVVWSSPDNGWLAVATGDFNGDGDDEIVAIKGSLMKVFDPIVQAGRSPVMFEQNVSPHVWELVATGDIDADGRDEIVLTRSDTDPNIKEHLIVWDGGTDGTVWTRVRDNGYGCPWRAITLGDVNGDGRDDIGMIRNCGSDRRVTILNPANWNTALHDKSYNFPWLDIAIGNTDRTTGVDGEEIVLTREDVVATLDSYLVMRWVSGSSSLQDVHGEKFYPYFTDIALGDVNNSGDEEVFLVRDPEQSNGISFILRNYGPDAVPVLEERIGRQWRAVVAGDVDGDGKAEAVILSSDTIRVYTDPEVSRAFLDLPGTYRTSGPGPLALGNLDGAGIAAEPQLGVDPTVISLELQAGSSATRTVNVSNVGAGGAFAWTASVTSGAGWLSVSPTSGSTPAVLTLTINASSLAPGDYTGKIQVSASGIAGSPKEVTVNLRVTPAPFQVSPLQIRRVFVPGQPFVPSSINVSGTGVKWVAGVIPAGDWDVLRKVAEQSGKLERVEGGWRAGEGAETVMVSDLSWVLLSPDRGTAPSVITVTVDPSRLGPGPNRATIVIDGGPGASPRLYGVDFMVVTGEPRAFLPVIVR